MTKDVYSNVVLPMHGGIMSAVLAHYLAFKEYTIHAVSFDWGIYSSPKSILASEKICEGVGADHKIVDLSSLRRLIVGEKKTRAIMNRDNIYLSMCIAYAFAKGCPTIFYPIYIVDQKFAHQIGVYSEMLREMVNKSSGGKVHLAYDFKMNEMHDVIRTGYNLDVPFEETWSCHLNGRAHCGKCPGCLARIEGFKNAGIVDPVKYAKASKPTAKKPR